jgi:hypothetical protein
MSSSQVELERAVAAAVDGGLLDSTREEIEAVLGERLQQQILSTATPGADTPVWSQGTFGPASLARRFIDFHREAIRAQICAPDGSGLKPALARQLKSKGARGGGLSAVAAATLTVLHAAVPVAGAGAIAVYVALWLLHADLQQWCQACAESADAPT